MNLLLMVMNQMQNAQSVVYYTQLTKKTYGSVVTGVLYGMILNVQS